MDLFDSFFKAIRGEDGAARVATSVSQFIPFVVDPAYQRLVSEAIMPWVQRMVRAVPAVWFHPDVRRQCSIGLQSGTCKARAATMCSVCRSNVCLSHCFISTDAACICVACVAVARKHVQPVVNAPPGDDERAQKVRVTEEDIAKAWKILNLDPDAEDDEIKASYTRLLRKWHPDRVESVEKKAKHEAKFKQVRWAYDTIQAVKRR